MDGWMDGWMDESCCVNPTLSLDYAYQAGRPDEPLQLTVDNKQASYFELREHLNNRPLSSSPHILTECGENESVIERE